MIKGNVQKYKKSTKSPKTQSWHWYSTPKSALKLEVSVLALVETTFAVGIFIWLAINVSTIHIVLSACFAPFLLLRTQKSTNLALTYGEAVFEKALKPSSWILFSLASSRWYTFIITPPVMLILLIWLAFVLLGIRFVTTVIFVIGTPIKSIMAIPVNWWRIVGCVDSFHPPETLPGYLARDDNNGWLAYEVFVIPFSVFSGVHYSKHLSEMKDIKGFLITFPVYFGMFIFFVLPAMAFRWSLKGSSVVYLPLIWIVRTATRGDIGRRLIDIRDLSFHRLRRWFGLFVIAFVISKLFATKMWEYLNATWFNDDLFGFVTLFVAPTEIP